MTEALETTVLTISELLPPVITNLKLSKTRAAMYAPFTGECGVTDLAVEAEAVLMICVQAALHPPSRALARRALEMMGMSLGYADLPAYMQLHLPPLGHAWFVDYRLDLHTLLAIKASCPGQGLPVKW